MLTISIERFDDLSEEERVEQSKYQSNYGVGKNYLRVRYNGETVSLEEFDCNLGLVPKLLRTIYELGKQDARAEEGDV